MKSAPSICLVTSLALCGCGPAPQSSTQIATSPPFPTEQTVLSLDTIKVTTSEPLRIHTPGGDAIVQFLSVTSDLHSATNPANSTTYRMLFPATAPISATTTNTLHDQFLIYRDPDMADLMKAFG